MSKAINIAGQKFGKLTAIKPTDKRVAKYIVWECLCDCGNKSNVAINALKNGTTKSCGCILGKNISNMQFGRLMAIKPTHKKIGRSIVWECQCSCGNKYEAPVSLLTSGGIKSCGCLHSELSKGELEKHIDFYTNVTKIKSNRIYSNNTSGVKGVSWVKHYCKWNAYITFQKKRYNLGYYTNIEDAIHVRKVAEEEKFGEFLKWYNNLNHTK
jgi:hypothetical protein